MDVIFGFLLFLVGCLAVFGLIASLPPSNAAPHAGGGHGGGGHAGHH
jgi:hypothetical protein